MNNVIISGQAHGFGSDRWRWVSFLSDKAKLALKYDSALVICERPFNDNLGKWYVVFQFAKSRWNHRLPDESERKLIESHFGG